MDLDFQPGKILMTALKFNEGNFIGSLTPFIKKYGLETAYSRFFSPLLEKSRILWQTGSLSRAQEQFVRSSIHNILIREDLDLKNPSIKAGTTIAMINTSDYLSDNNFLFYKYALKKRGFEVIFTGGILPSSEVIEIHKIKPFDYLVVNSGAFDFAHKKIGYFSSIGKSLLLKKIIFTDYTESEKKKIPENIIITRNPQEFIKTIDTGK